MCRGRGGGAWVRGSPRMGGAPAVCPGCPLPHCTEQRVLPGDVLPSGTGVAASARPRNRWVQAGGGYRVLVQGRCPCSHSQVLGQAWLVLSGPV